MNFNCVIGIDPGKKGCISVITNEMKTPICFDMPETLLEIQQILLEYKKYNPIVYLEKVSMWMSDIQGTKEMSEDQKKKNIGKAMRLQKLFNNYSELKATIKLTGIDLIECTPAQWRKGLSLKSIKDKTERKNANKRHASFCFPNHKRITHQTADSLLILQYGLIKMSGGKLIQPKKEPPKQGLLF